TSYHDVLFQHKAPLAWSEYCGSCFYTTAFKPGVGYLVMKDGVEMLVAEPLPGNRARIVMMPVLVNGVVAAHSVLKGPPYENMTYYAYGFWDTTEGVHTVDSIPVQQSPAGLWEKTGLSTTLRLRPQDANGRALQVPF
ncbi:TPA: hypothetical protein DCZ32_04720, partial [Candidatus Uhrbacteria bacterium]|nr:hypothetical protein [Candidatus Uhrbacteria bacterium]